MVGFLDSENKLSWLIVTVTRDGVSQNNDNRSHDRAHVTLYAAATTWLMSLDAKNLGLRSRICLVRTTSGVFESTVIQ